ncbi:MULTISPECIES: ferrochelatase [unclassified Hyphomicrobium]|uniref:ferrochelatase n=1 Tax=unclassified Hyphomicrobium TaxID=2619925 RepID=UPI000213E3B0|nr:MULTISPECIES: ferrochelatase [unclassified Hyphomicrobium]CCB63969.1 ferrochelatase [Hyphomicrobium sp. MC1]
MNEVPKQGDFDSERTALPGEHAPVALGRIGVLLLNLGTPDGTSYWPMRRYLKEFLSDDRVIEEPKWKWWPILNLIILTTRPSRKGRDYATIWNNEKNEGPLKTITRNQAERLAQRLGNDPRVIVDWAMRYANPTTESRIRALKEQGCDRILLVPLYPQYSAATTATANDQAFRALMKMRWQPAIRTSPSYHDHPAYIGALATSMRAELSKLDFEPEKIIATFHGMPEKYFAAGDPYHCQCQKTSRLLREKLGIPESRWLTTFQSRFGTDPWLQPYTDKTVEALAKSGVKKIALVAPGFSADCLETLEELDRENRHIFESNGGEKFAYLPALNDSPEGVDVIEVVVRRELAGWL